MTDVERKLWQRLRGKQLGEKFRRQYPIDNYIVDFVCLEKRLIIECDGGQHAEQESKDSERDKHLQGKGFMVLRIWNNEIIENLDGVLETIYYHLDNNE